MIDLGVPIGRHNEHDRLIKTLSVPEHLQSILPAPNPTQPFWLDIDDPEYDLAKAGAAGSLNTDADICIIGSGSSGISAAYHLSRLLKGAPSKTSIVMLEGRDFCSGATGRNGGHLTPISFSGFSSIADSYGTEDALANAALEQHVYSELIGLSQTHGWSKDIDLVVNKRTILFITESDQERIERDFDRAQQSGLPLLDQIDWLGADEVKKRYGTEFRAVRKPGSNVWPYKLFTKLYKLAQSNSPPDVSLTLHTGTPVNSITDIRKVSQGSATARRWAIHTPRGDVTCKYVLHATNGYASHLLPHLQIIPTRGQVIATRASVPSSDITDSAWVSNAALEYWFPRPTPSPSDCPLIILGGAREVPQNFEFYEVDDSVVVDDIGKGLRKILPRLFPGKFDEAQKPEKEWTGILGFTRTGAPFVGPVPDPTGPENKAFEGQFISAGFHGHGMPRTYACAEAIAQMIVADIHGKADQWIKPSWLPSYYLTSHHRISKKA